MFQFPQKYWAAQLFLTLKMFLEQQISILEMISEGSCDSEDWSNDAENSALITAINYSLTDSHRKQPF